MTVYRIHARCIAQPPVADWQDQLARRLGGRPRRMGCWAELGLYGALECLANGAESTLPAHAALVLSSQHGPALAMRSALAQAREGLPLPLTFLQTQPSQLLASLSTHLHWCGDARFITHPDPLAVLALALAIADNAVDRPAEGLLLGWVNELETRSSIWLRLQPVADPGGTNGLRDQSDTWQEARDGASVLQHASHVKREAGCLKVIIAPNQTNADQVH